MAYTKVDEVVGTLVREILSRRIGNGTHLESEWGLRQRFGCSRNTVREALERLVGAGLVAKSAGERFWVNSEAVWPLEVLADELLVTREADQAAKLLDDLIEFQRSNLVAVARLAAKRRTDSSLFALDLSFSELRRSVEWADDHLIARYEGELLDTLVDSAASRTLRLCGRVAARLVHRLGVTRPEGQPWARIATWRQLLEALRAEDAETAASLASRLLDALYASLRRTYLRAPERPSAERVDPQERPTLETEMDPAWEKGEADSRFSAGIDDSEPFTEWRDPAESTASAEGSADVAGPAESTAPTDP